jgi:uncharacterized protein YndB with AHSA1/START domain
MAEGTRGYAHRVDVHAPADLLWRGLTEPALLQTWYGSEARVDARAGGSHWVRVNRELAREAHIDIYDPPRRLRLIYLPWLGAPAGEAAITDDFLLATESRFTVVRLLGGGIPEARAWDAVYQQQRSSWEWMLMRFKVAMEKQAALRAP